MASLVVAPRLSCSTVCGIFSAATAAAKSLQSCLTLCDTIDGSPPGSPVPGILQARTLEWVDLPRPGIRPVSLTLASRFPTTGPPGNPYDKVLRYILYIIFCRSEIYLLISKLLEKGLWNEWTTMSGRLQFFSLNQSIAQKLALMQRLFTFQENLNLEFYQNGLSGFTDAYKENNEQFFLLWLMILRPLELVSVLISVIIWMNPHFRRMKS